ncbi:hypothetical protein CR513_36044, partial [Mucuna pruriens]
MERKGGCDHLVRRIPKHPPYGYPGSHKLSRYPFHHPRLRRAKRRMLKENLAHLEKRCQKGTRMGTAKLWGLIQLQVLASTQNKMHPLDIQRSPIQRHRRRSKNVPRQRTLDRSHDLGKIPERVGAGLSPGRERKANGSLGRLRVEGSRSQKSALPASRADNPTGSGCG